MFEKLKLFMQDDSGATAMEYALLAAMLGIGCIAAFTVMGDSLENLFGVSGDGAGSVMEAAASSV